MSDERRWDAQEIADALHAAGLNVGQVSRVAQALSLRPTAPETRERTHWEGCYTTHHECAIAEVERLRASRQGEDAGALAQKLESVADDPEDRTLIANYRRLLREAAAALRSRGEGTRVAP